MKKSKPKILIFLASIIIISGYLLIGSIIENDKLRNLKLLLNEEQKQLIKKYIFPYKFISQQQKIISQQQQIISKYNQIDWLYLELEKKMEVSEITTEENIVKLTKNKTLKKYKFKTGFYAGIFNNFPERILLGINFSIL